jgi:hypothetical protein
MMQADVLKFLIEKGPGRTQVELAKAIHGPSGYQQQVNQDLDLLVSRGLIERRGKGGAAEPYQYYPQEN